MNEERKLLDNGNVEVITTKEVPRYVGQERYDECECQMISEDFMEQNKVWMTKHSREGFQVLDTKENWEPEGESVEADIESFQKYLDEEYGEGKYEAYSIGAYIHSMVSFSFNKGEDNRCRWDSGTVGFVGINKELRIDLNTYARSLSDAWNGTIEVLEVVDNLTDDVVDEIYSTEEWKEIHNWKENVKEKYGVTEFKQLY